MLIERVRHGWRAQRRTPTDAAGRVSGSRQILLVTTWYPTTEAPVAGVFVRDQAEALAAAGNDVRVLHLVVMDYGVRRAWDLRSGGGVPPVWRIRTRVVPPALRSPLAVLAAVVVAARWRAGGFRPRLVHAHTDRAGLAAVAVARLLGVPAVITEHSTAFLDADPTQLSRLRRLSARLAFRAADATVAVGEPLRLALLRLQPRARAVVVPNVVDLARLAVRQGQRPAGRSFTAVGFLVPQKGLFDLLEAFALLAKTLPDATLHLVGDGPLRSELEARAGELGVRERVEFHGALAPEDVGQVLHESDVFVSASHFETFGVAVVEALATGMPVVVTASGGPESFVSDEVGRVAPVGDVTALAAAMADVAGRLPTFEPARLADYVRIRFGPEQLVRSLYAVYDAAGTRAAARRHLPRRRA